MNLMNELFGNEVVNLIDMHESFSSFGFWLIDIVYHKALNDRNGAKKDFPFR